MTNLPRSVIVANDDAPTRDALAKACGEAVEELRAARRVLVFLPEERAAAQELLVTEKSIVANLRELRTLDADGLSGLRELLAKANQQLSNKDAQIEILKKEKKFSLLQKIGLVLIGVGIGATVIAVKN